MWRLYLMLSLQVMTTKSLPMYLPEMIPQSPLPLLQEELMRLQAMQVQHITEMQQLQAVQVQALSGMQQFQNMPGMQQIQAVPGNQLMQHLQDMQQFQHLQSMQQLQQAQDMQQLKAIPDIPMNRIQPIIVLLPGQNIVRDNNPNQATKRNKDNKKGHKETVDEDLESVAIEAEEPIPVLEDQKAILLMPNPRFSLNAIISAIPFLPFEINVPDTISWMYNAIISIIGQIQGSQGNRLKFKNFGNFVNGDQQLRPIIIIPL